MKRIRYQYLITLAGILVYSLVGHSAITATELSSYVAKTDFASFYTAANSIASDAVDWNEILELPLRVDGQFPISFLAMSKIIFGEFGLFFVILSQVSIFIFAAKYFQRSLLNSKNKDWIVFLLCLFPSVMVSLIFPHKDALYYSGLLICLGFFFRIITKSKIRLADYVTLLFGVFIVWLVRPYFSNVVGVVVIVGALSCYVIQRSLRKQISVFAPVLGICICFLPVSLEKGYQIINTIIHDTYNTSEIATSSTLSGAEILESDINPPTSPITSPNTSPPLSVIETIINEVSKVRRGFASVDKGEEYLLSSKTSFYDYQDFAVEAISSFVGLLFSPLHNNERPLNLSELRLGELVYLIDMAVLSLGLLFCGKMIASKTMAGSCIYLLIVCSTILAIIAIFVIDEPLALRLRAVVPHAFAIFLASYWRIDRGPVH